MKSKNTNSLLLQFVIFLVIFIFPISIPAQEKQIREKTDSLKIYFEKARTDWEVPGLAIAIVKDGEIILSEGFGVRDIEKGGKVNGQTMFPIASNTKAFTAAALAILVDEGKISWQDKVTTHIPYFRLYDPYVSENMTIRDLLCHRSGLATFSGDLVWYGTDYNREEVIRRARFLKPVYGFREQFGYSNIMFLAAGEIIPAVTGISWDVFLKTNFFTPLRMKRTITSTNDLGKFDNIAIPHTDFDGKVIPIEYLNWDNIGPAGSIISCVDDMSQWLKLQLNRGIFEKDTIFSAKQSREMWSPNMILGVSESSQKMWPSTYFKAYALGWQVMNYKDRKIVSHSGGYDGMISYSCVVPDENLGFVILTNKNSSLYYPLVYKILDNFLGGDQKDWSQLILERMKKNEEAEKLAKAEAEKNRVTNTTPSLSPEGFTGTYGGELYGDATVNLENEALVVKFIPSPKLVGTLKHLYYNTFAITFKEFPSLPPGTCNFILDDKGKVSEMKIDVPNPDFDFTELQFLKKN
jgi:CubicO group peptidase (beta-lactamase class C family)